MKTDILALIRANIKRIRTGKKIKQNSLAEKIGIYPSHYNRIETGGDGLEPSITTLQKVAEALEIELYELFLPIEVYNQPLLEKLAKLQSLPEEDRQTVERMINITLDRQEMKKEAK